MQNVPKMIFASIILSFIWVLPAALGKAFPKTARIIPPETIVLVDIENFSQLQQQYEKTNFYKLYKDPAMAEFFENVKSKLREKVGKLDSNNMFRAFFDADVCPEGKAAFALVLNEKTKDINEPSILFICQWGQNTDKIKEAVNKMVEKNTEMGGHKKRNEDYRGVSIESIVDERAATMAYCFIDDCFFAASDAELLKFVIAHIQGITSPTLADDSDYSTSFADTGPYHDIDVYINIKQIIGAAKVKESSGEDQQMITNLGFDNVAAFSFSMGMARRTGSSYCGKLLLKINGAKKGVCKMLELETSSFRVPKFIPSAAHSITSCNLNIKKAYDELYNIMYKINPMGASAMCAPILPPSPSGEPGLQLKNDIVDHLGSQIIIAESLNKPFSNDKQPQETLIAVAVNNRAAIEKSLSLLHSQFIAENNPDAKRELLGHTIYLIDVGRMFPIFSPGEKTPLENPSVRNRPKMPTFAFTITDSHFIYGTDATVERAIRTLKSTGSSSADSSKWFIATKSTIPSVLGLAALEDNAASVEFLWWLMKEKGKAQSTGAMVGPNPQMMLARGTFNSVNFELLPQFDVVRKYFNMSSFYGISRPDGFFFEFNYLSPGKVE